MNFTGLSDAAVIDVYTSAIEELTKRGIFRTKNMTGELGERIVIDFFNSNSNLPNLSLADVGQDYYDALDSQQKRFSIKTATSTATGTFHAMDEVDKEYFDYLIVCKLNKTTFRLEHIYLYTWKQFVIARNWHKTMGAWFIPLTKKSISNAEILF